MPNCIGSLTTADKDKGKYRFWATTILSFCNLIKDYLHKTKILFKDTQPCKNW